MFIFVPSYSTSQLAFVLATVALKEAIAASYQY